MILKGINWLGREHNFFICLWYCISDPLSVTCNQNKKLNFKLNFKNQWSLNSHTQCFIKTNAHIIPWELGKDQREECCKKVVLNALHNSDMKFCLSRVSCSFTAGEFVSQFRRWQVCLKKVNFSQLSSKHVSSFYCRKTHTKKDWNLSFSKLSLSRIKICRLSPLE